MVPPFTFEYGVAEDKNGRFRKTMEDTHITETNFDGVEGQGFFVIFDGHGGKKSASYSQENFVKDFLGVKNEFPELSVPEVFDKSFQLLDEGLKREGAMYSGCTSVAVFLEVKSTESEAKTMLFTANVGDARAVLCRNGKAIRLSYDHKASDPHEQKRVTEAGGVIMNDRVNGSLAVTRALGDIALKSVVVSRPYTTETTITKDDSFIILACDGVWDVFSDQDAADAIKDLSAQEAADALVKQSIEKGSMDNITAVVVKLNATQ